MGQIPAEDKTIEETVTEAKAALEARESTEATLRARLGDATKRVDELTTACGNLSAEWHIAEAEQASELRLAELRESRDAKFADLRKARAEVESLTHAVSVSAGRTSDARIALTRVAYRNSINRCSKRLERLLAETVRLENAIDTSVGHYRKILEHIEALKSSWPGGELPPLEIFSGAGLTAAIQEHTWRVSADIDPYLNLPKSKYPGAHCFDLLLAGRPDAIVPLSDRIDDARRHLLDVLEGRKDSRTGAAIPSITETAPAAPAV